MLYIVSSAGLDFGLLGILAAQVGLFALMGVWIAKEKKRSSFTKMPRP